jgi:hypothetical protein
VVPPVVPFRFSGVFGGSAAVGLDQLNAWKAGIKYGITAANTVDLGWEQTQWAPIAGSGSRENYYTIGLGHTFNSNASLKLLYQIIDYKAGALDVYGDGNYRGGMTAAEFLLKY